jgi:decaprenylphospho-beta-D-erythro-pentofuranosid-2-ulose 2-reductase
LFAQADLNDPLGTHETVERLWQQTDFDLVILTAGVLPESKTEHSDPDAAVSAAMVNFVGQLAVGAQAMRRFDERGSGYLVVMSSVAAERIRPDNYLYGATKAGLDGWAVGAAHARRNSPVRVMVVRPGMVRTRMSRGMKEVPFTTDADELAVTVVRHLRRGATVIWCPAVLKYVMMVLRHLPARFFFALTARD